MAHYNLIFQGKIIDGASLDEVKNNISRLFKTDTAKTDALFSGKSIIIKKNLDTESTKKYLAVIKKAGAIVKAVKIESSEKPSTPITETSHTANTSTSSKTSNNLSSGLASLVNYNSSTSESTDTDKKSIEQSTASEEKGLQLAPVGSDIPITRNKQDDIEAPDISHLSMSEAETGSLEEFAQIVEAVVLPDIDKLTMSEANTGSMEEFAVKVDAVELPDISDLNVAAQDDTALSAQSPKQTPIDIPDTSDLSMSAAQDGTLEGIGIKPEAVKIPDTTHLEIEKQKEKQANSGKAVFQID
ncbi:MAG: hypothetical protein GQ546_02485 [Gammaproteobacteria bacterium]|nr:hypothetical protein [Gammaproteobacteria bacterium]